MADAPPPPVAIRITRPYDSEEEFLAQELEMISKTSITLVGAQPRPQGVVLRFELVLASGLVLVRGEGRVVGSKPNVHKGVGGLTLRFTRIDARSKAFLDKATSLREMRRPSSKPPKAVETATAAADALPPSAPPPPPAPEAAAEPRPATPAASEPTLPAALTALAVPLPTPPTPALALETPEANAEAEPPPPPPLPREADEVAKVTEVAEVADGARPDAPPSARAASPPQDRDALLDRLRNRAKALEPAALQRILEKRGTAQ